MLLCELLGTVGVSCPQKYQNVEICDVVTDSDKVTYGCMFICIKGNNSDGHDHMKKAIQKGAFVIVCEQLRDECVGGAAAIIMVENTRRVAALIYDAYNGCPSKKLKVIGVTGTNGKTSVCHLLESIFTSAGKPCAVIGTVGVRINGKKTDIDTCAMTTPPPERLYAMLAEMVRLGVEYVFMEVSSHALYQYRTEAVGFCAAIFTNLTRDHLDYHGDMEQYFLAKSRLFEQAPICVINTDDAYGKRLSSMFAERAVCCSRARGDFVAKNIRLDKRYVEYDLVHAKNELNIRMSAGGEFSVINSLVAAATAIRLGIDESYVTGGLCAFAGVSGRMQRVTDASAPFEVIIDYAHTPDALEKLLMSVRQENTVGDLILVFGCGGDRDRGKRKQMARVASRLADLVVVTSDNPRGEPPMSIISDIMKGIDKEKPHKTLVLREDAIKYALSVARTGDTVILAGKGHEKYQIDADGYHAFDEEAIVKNTLGLLRE